MIRRVFSLRKEMLWDCFYIANQFVDAALLASWAQLKYKVDSGQVVLFVDEKDNGFLRGFLLGGLESNVAVVNNLFVDKRFQRGGVGSALLQAYEDFARSGGIQQIKLQSRPTKQAMSFYQKNGYAKMDFGYNMQKTL